MRRFLSFAVCVGLAMSLAGCGTSKTPTTTSTAPAPPAKPAATSSPAMPGAHGTHPHEMKAPHAMPKENSKGSVEGTLVHVGKDRVFLKTPSGMQFIFYTNEKFTVTPKAKLDSIKPGTKLKIDYHVEGGKMEVQTIEQNPAKSAAKPAAKSAAKPAKETTKKGH